MAYSITPRLIMEAARKRGWQVEEIDPYYAFYKLTLPDGRFHYVRNITMSKNNVVNSIIADRKDLFAQLCRPLGLPLPDTLLYTTDRPEADVFLDKHRKIVVKPHNQSHGNGVTVDVTSPEELDVALTLAKSYGERVLLQQQVYGDDYRLLFIDKKLAAAAVRKPAFVVGDGTHTIRQLITLENDSDRRSAGYQATLTDIDEVAAAAYLRERLDTIPHEGDEVQVVGTANIGRGGVSIDVTDTIDPQLVQIGQTLVDHFGMGLAGVDILYEEGGQPYLIEVNTGPSLGLHENPYQGKARNTPDAYLDWLAKA